MYPTMDFNKQIDKLFVVVPRVDRLEVGKGKRLHKHDAG